MLIFKISGSEILCAWPKFNQAPLSHLLQRLRKFSIQKISLIANTWLKQTLAWFPAAQDHIPGWLRPVKFLIWKTQGEFTICSKPNCEYIHWANTWLVCYWKAAPLTFVIFHTPDARDPTWFFLIRHSPLKFPASLPGLELNSIYTEVSLFSNCRSKKKILSCCFNKCLALFLFDSDNCSRADWQTTGSGIYFLFILSLCYAWLLIPTPHRRTRYRLQFQLYYGCTPAHWKRGEKNRKHATL